MTALSTWMWPVLPEAQLLPLGIALSWGVTLAAGLWMMARAWRSGLLRVLAFLSVVTACLPWTREWTAYLALAFQTPSWVSLIACVAAAWLGDAPRRPLAQDGRPNSEHHTELSTPSGEDALLPWIGLVLGWGLWLDTFNRWPMGWSAMLYAQGFGAPMLWALVMLALGLAGWHWQRTHTLTRMHQVLAAALLAFAVTRGPTGNVWDAVLDPWLWAACHVYALRWLWRQWRTSKYSRQNSKASGV